MNTTGVFIFTHTCTLYMYTVNRKIFVVHVKISHIKFWSNKIFYSLKNYENLTHILLFLTCLKGEHGGALKTLLHWSLPCL